MRFARKNAWAVFFDWADAMNLPGFTNMGSTMWGVHFEGARITSVMREVSQIGAYFEGRHRTIELRVLGFDAKHPVDSAIELTFPILDAATQPEWEFLLRSDLPGDPQVVFMCRENGSNMNVQVVWHAPMASNAYLNEFIMRVFDYIYRILEDWSKLDITDDRPEIDVWGAGAALGVIPVITRIPCMNSVMVTGVQWV
jgi:hypothetical protein